MSVFYIIPFLITSRLSYSKSKQSIRYATYIGGLADEDWASNIWLGENDDTLLRIKESQKSL